MSTPTIKQGRMYKIVSWCGQRVIALAEAIFKKYSKSSVDAPAWVTDLCLHTETIRAEFLQLYDQNLREFSVISPEQRRITSGRSWKVFVLRAYGRALRENCALCPKTALWTQKIPEIKTVLFSVLEAGTHIIPHRGPYAGVLRCHIPLIIPDGDCGIRVGTEVYRWKGGEPLVFDDTLDHEAWNRTTERRVVLFIDYLRPLPWSLALINRFMVWLIGRSPFIGRALKASL